MTRDYGPPRWRELVAAVPAAIVGFLLLMAFLAAAGGMDVRP